MTGGVGQNDVHILQQLGFNNEQINYLITQHPDMDILFLQNSVNGVPGNLFFENPKTPDQIIQELQDNDDDINNQNNNMNNGNNPMNNPVGGKRRSNKRKTRKTRKYGKRRQHGGGFTTSISTPLKETKNDYNTYVKLNLEQH